MSVLAERLLTVDGALDTAGIPHAFGGAIALAYCTEEPRATRDLDVNVFVGVDRADAVLAALPDPIDAGPEERAALLADGQVRLWWDDMPVDLFFDVHDFHRHAATAVRIVPFAGALVPVLGCAELAVFKVLFDRTKDWADIEAMREAGALDGATVLGFVTALLGADDARVVRLDALLRA